MAGAAEKQSEIWSEQDKRRDAYREKMEAMYMAGMQERQKEYDTKAKVYNQIKSARASGDNQAAFAAYAKLHPELTAKNMKDTYGGEWEADLAKKDGMLSARMDAAIAQWDGRKRPTLDMENMVVDRATYLRGNEEEYKAHIRDLYSLDPVDDGVLYASKVKGSIFDRVASEGKGKGGLSSRLTQVEGADGRVTTYKEVYDKETQETVSVKPLIDKKPEQGGRELSKDTKKLINIEATRRIGRLKDDKNIDANVREGIEELSQGKNNPITGAVAAEAMRLAAGDSTMSAEEAGVKATEMMVLAAKNGAIQKEDGFFGDYYWTGKVKMYPPNSERAVWVPFYDMAERLKEGGRLENE
jgi:hypothetical protein